VCSRECWCSSVRCFVKLDFAVKLFLVRFVTWPVSGERPDQLVWLAGRSLHLPEASLQLPPGALHHSLADGRRYSENDEEIHWKTFVLHAWPGRKRRRRIIVLGFIHVRTSDRPGEFVPFRFLAKTRCTVLKFVQLWAELAWPKKQNNSSSIVKNAIHCLEIYLSRGRKSDFTVNLRVLSFELHIFLEFVSMYFFSLQQCQVKNKLFKKP